MKLYTKITIGLVAGIAVGWVLNIGFNEKPFTSADSDEDKFLTIPELLASKDNFAKYKNSERIKLDDQDGDGALTMQEIVEARDARILKEDQENFTRVDVNGDGIISFNELYRDGGAFQRFAQESAFTAADTDSSGGLNLSEISAALGLRMSQAKNRFFSELDANRDQVLNAEELLKTQGAFREFLDQATYNKADLNQDGLLTAAEIILSGEDLTVYLATGIFERTDRDGDLRISFKEEKQEAGWQSITKYTDPVGSIFIRLVKMVVVPLILASLILGAANLGDIRKLGKIGLKAFGFFMLTTAVAVSIGVLFANVFRPGDGLPDETRDSLVAQYQDQAGAKIAAVTDGPQKSEAEKIMDLLVNMIPTNPLEALTEGDMLAIIFFSIFFGICLTLIGASKAKPFIEVMEGLNEVVLKMVTLAMETAPYGVFALIMGVVANMGIDILVPLLKYGAVVAGGLLMHVAITHFSFISFYLRKNPLRFLGAIKEAILLGFSTSSSSATLPISMNVAQANLNVSNEVSSFVLPLGATINMDGTALYQGVAAIFIAQVYSIDLSFMEQLVMVLTATLASVGAAGVPGAGMITLAVVLGTAGIPVEGIALIFGLDRLLDMFRTSVNIIGDITCSAVMAKSEGEEVIIRKDRDVIEG